jgi:hypothetical protein
MEVEVLAPEFAWEEPVEVELLALGLAWEESQETSRLLRAPPRAS